MNLFKKQKIPIWFFQMAALSLFFHVLASLLSEGFNSYDEHFQILEFANSKLTGGKFDADMPWEFHQRIRPWFQPLLVFYEINILHWMGIDNPHTIALLVRLAHSLTGFLSCIFLGLCCLKWFSDPKIQKWSVGFVCLLWYVPYIHARTSSENLSTSFFIFGLATLVLSERILWIHALVAGLCFGLSFEFRFQLIFMIAGLMAWAIYTRKLSTKCFLVLTGSGLSVATAALVIDRWGYGQWTFVLWRYFSANFIDGALNEFGIQPWWFYLRFLLIVLPPLSSILALLAIAGFFRKALHPVTWACGPFIVFHLLVGHKEPRFLFPVFLTAPMMAFYGLSKSRIFNFVSAYKNWCYFFLFANFVVLLHLAMTSSKRQVGVYRSLYQEIKAPFKYYVLGEDPFEPSGLKPHFYYGEVQRLGTLHSPDELMSLDAVRPFYLISDASLQNQVLKFSCQELWTNEPHIFSGDGLARWLRRFRVHSWFLYQCQKAPKLREEFSQ